MSVAGHLRIELEAYDASIRAFVPGYEAMLREAAAVLADLPAADPQIVDVGVGTGALAAACLAVRPDARLTGIDADPGMLAAARERLAGTGSGPAAPVRLVEADFLEAALPACDAIVASLALHHVPSPAAKRAFYDRCAAALRPGGVLVSADRFLADERPARAGERQAWLAHLERSFTPAEARGHLEAWAEEDRYFPLGDELGWLRAAGLAPQVTWREPGFAVVAAWRGGPEDGSGRRTGTTP